MNHFVLPAPKLVWPATFADALRSRETQREISTRPLPASVLSNLLFAACHSQEIVVYLALPTGTYRFEPGRHELCAITNDDLRAHALEPRQPPAVPEAPVQLLYVADVALVDGFEEPAPNDDAVVQKSYYFVDAGLTAENVYLFAVAHGLACWIHNCDRAALAQSLKLSATERVLFAQTVGYPRAP